MYAVEDNVGRYKMENGKRSDLPVRGTGSGYGGDADVPDQGWGELRVTARGPLFEVYLGGRKLFEVEDRTLTGAGRVGVWTQADSVTSFDHLRIANLDHTSQPSRSVVQTGWNQNRHRLCLNSRALRHTLLRQRTPTPGKPTEATK